MCSTEIPAQNTYGQKIILIILNMVVHSVKDLFFGKIKYLMRMRMKEQGAYY